jgi:hypothetical protein
MLVNLGMPKVVPGFQQKLTANILCNKIWNSPPTAAKNKITFYLTVVVDGLNLLQVFTGKFLNKNNLGKIVFGTGTDLTDPFYGMLRFFNDHLLPSLFPTRNRKKIFPSSESQIGPDIQIRQRESKSIHFSFFFRCPNIMPPILAINPSATWL